MESGVPEKHQHGLGLPSFMETHSIRESVTAAIRFWEPRRLIYNGVLASIVLIYFGLNYPASKAVVSIDSISILFLLAVFANIAYCAAYLVDIFVRSSSYLEQWRKYRWLVFVIGLLFATIITRFIAAGVFQPVSPRGL
jgi:hypothetical protein